jgi:hypothetical protein
MDPATVARITFEIPAAAAVWLEDAAAERGMSMAELMRKAVASYVVGKEFAEKKRKRLVH